jgi:hypothetical protein
MDETEKAPEPVVAQEPDPNEPWSPDELAANLTQDDKQAIKEQLPLLNEVITWFDERIAEYGNPETISGVNISSDPQHVKEAVLFAQTMIKDYKSKRNEFNATFKKYIAALEG